ncbi:hypothetical protein [Marinitoga sp. 1155]|nr:hypothetical protein [Marinitoga sp. 1155]KLO21736.1 hypothetical protein X274_09580 [Marinitoga sp. 1155]
MKKIIVMTLIVISFFSNILYAGDDYDYSSTNSINPQIQNEFLK